MHCRAFRAWDWSFLIITRLAREGYDWRENTLGEGGWCKPAGGCLKAGINTYSIHAPERKKKVSFNAADREW